MLNFEYIAKGFKERQTDKFYSNQELDEWKE